MRLYSAGSSSVYLGLFYQRDRLPGWAPGKVEDPVQRVRNFLFVAASADLLQLAELEPGAPLAVYDRLRADMPRDDLVKILYWIATHPDEGNDAALEQLAAACVPTSSSWGGSSSPRSSRSRRGRRRSALS